MNLREQIRQIGIHWVGRNYTEAVTWPLLVNYLAIRAFIQEIPESTETRAIRKAFQILESVGWVTEEEPSVE